MTPQNLLVCIVERGCGNALVALARKAGAQGGTILPGKGTAASTLLQVLGLGDSDRDIVVIVLPAANPETILDAVRNAPSCRKKIRGPAFTLDLLTVLRSAAPMPLGNHAAPPAQTGEIAMHTHELIAVVVTAGYAEDIMHAARRAGAGGGTLLHARGTAKDDDEKFFGVPIVPEKEFLMILAERDRAPAILEAVRAAPCLSQPGMGIAFSMPATQVFSLGS